MSELAGIVDSKLPTVGVFAKATAADTPKAVVTKTDEAVRSISAEKAAKVILVPVGKKMFCLPNSKKLVTFCCDFCLQKGIITRVEDTYLSIGSFCIKN